MSEQREIQQNITGTEYAATSATGDATITITNYYYREEAKLAPADSTGAVDEDIPCPYRGLFHFGPNDAEFFFGREIFIDKLDKCTKNSNFIPVLGASGSGKSSVVLAGLVPKLQKEGHWQFTHFRPGSDPFQAIALALVPLYTPNLDQTEQIFQSRKLADYLQNASVPLADIFAKIHQNHPNYRLLLIVDQFEEIYTLCHNQEIRRKFLDCLLASLETPTSLSSSATVLVTTMRADFLGNALSYRPFADILQNADIKLGPMNREELTEVIEKPAEKLGVKFETGLVERILDDVQNQPGNLPLLEFALTELWNKRTGKQLTHKTYEEIGQVEGALARHADEKYGNLKDEEKEKVRRIFIQLVRPGEGTEDTRRIAMKAELGDENWFLVKQLADARLVVTSRNLTSQETVEVVHEALIRNWGELREWMNTNRVFRAWQERLRSAKGQWEATERDSGSLLRGAALEEAEEKLKERSEDLIDEKEFIEQSIQERDRLKQAEAQQRQRIIQWLSGGLLAVSILAGLALWQWKLGEDARTATRLELEGVNSLNKFDADQDIESLLLAIRSGRDLQSKVNNSRPLKDYPAVSPILALQTILDRIQVKNQVKASQNSDLLKNFSNKSALKNKLADFNTGHGKSIIIYNPDIPNFITLGENGTIRFWQSPQQPINTAFKITDSFDINNFQEYEKIWFSPNLQIIAVRNSSEDGNSDVSFWDVNGTKIGNFGSNQIFSVRKVIFSQDAKNIAVLEQWDGGEGTQILHFLKYIDSNQIINTSQSILSYYGEIKFTQDGENILTGEVSEYQDFIQIWKSQPELQIVAVPKETSRKILGNKYFNSEVDDFIYPLWADGKVELELGNKQIVELKGQKNWFNTVIFSPNKQHIASLSEDGKVRFWNLSGKLVEELKSSQTKISKIIFSPDSQYIATVDDSGLMIRQVGSNYKIIAQIKGQQSWFFSISFSPDGQRIVAGSTTNRMVRMWDLAGRKLAELKITDPRVFAKINRRLSTGDGYSLNVGFTVDSKYIVIDTYIENPILLWKVEGLDDLLTRGCNWLDAYLKNPDISESDRYLCQGI
ncbi:WD40 repeat domain-containing protein [Cronbergia sp. UHCC 0137]|uniref:WD40 repeat domain-containing protein n=1 Tax=Cronbergia sp. UHCC 0137 TaxID=3110239 RepID=UPI002B214680|nr:WD40 repeat domain-containing protein [Cronbergia sp. UHCC 0137]MEA5618110.1 WD40 repeat domain-containing protein [Cronbergia sp. UHCC 0137]